tara:strand:- start:179 stop:652 length:474 start_codon:yes stop_codon:yes gene_type:complete
MPKPEDKDILAARFSADLVGLLRGVVRAHNKGREEDKKVSLSQLKDVYKNAAENYSYAGYSRGEWALARVYTFLDSLNGDAPQTLKNYERKQLGGLIFETKVIATDEEFDIAKDWIPSQKNFTKAKTDIKEQELFFDFSNPEELYLEDYKPCNIKIY